MEATAAGDTPLAAEADTRAAVVDTRAVAGDTLVVGAIAKLTVVRRTG